MTTEEERKERARDLLLMDLKGQSPMDKDVKERWIAALRSGKYKRGSGYLRRDTDAGVCHCCLGVLAEEELGDRWVRREDDPRVYCLSRTGVSRLITDTDSSGFQLGYNSMRALSSANDRGLSFAEIADAIEECL